MKKPLQILVLITAAFAAFLFGFFSGRNMNRTPVQIRQVPAVTRPVSTAGAEDTQVPTVPPIIDINCATVQQLENLPGIGPVLAQRIVDYRNEYGAFTTPGDLLLVEGIGESKLEEIWDLITVGG